MKKKLSLSLLTALAALLTIQSGVFDALIAFLLVGAIPGTTYSVPPAAMMTLGVIALWALTIRFAAIPLLTFIAIDRLARHHLSRRERLPKRRFGQI